ncbi:hypothetical protein FA95DRAFT_310766 [Auriscalpium vulgare]|uniref:Uncharacterized protein n=1 Tax=Auriscalpium vulgare TaxID=40419 RepID=A0ACB8S404_9AGAM|nr:hypothetical protein FA95DRAFT_310766 [Auriscalpium vulgare]
MSTTDTTSGQTMTKAEIDELYPVPATKGTLPLPGPTRASADVLIAKLKHNYKHHHIFFNAQNFHNHATHHLFAVYALGAPPELLEEVYETHSYQKPVVVSPEPITDNNFTQHLGDSAFYSGYLAYFSSYLLTHTATEALERFVFSQEYIFVPELKENGAQQPEMLSRLLAGVLHPMIHVGYGIEFGVPGQTAEGLAQTAIHPPELIPTSVFSFSPPGVSGIVPAVENNKTLSKPKRPTFEFHQKVFKSPLLRPSALGLSTGLLDQYETVLPRVRPVIFDYVREWSEKWLQGAGENEAEERLKVMVEEVTWGNSLWFGVGGWGARGEDRVINADFYNMHLVTSAIFLPTFLLPDSSTALSPPLPFAHRLLLLEAYLATCATWHVSRGNPAIVIEDFFNSPSTAMYLTAPPMRNEVASEAKGKVDKVNFDAGRALRSGGSTWPRVVASTLLHDNEHLCKVTRALGYSAETWGGREVGYYRSDDEGLDGVEKLDGTLFVRLAGLVTERLGWVAEGMETHNWDYDGYF